MNHIEVIGRGLREYRGRNFLARRSHHLHRPSDGDETWQIHMSSLQRQADLYFVHEFLQLRNRIGQQGVYVKFKGVYHEEDDNGFLTQRTFKPPYFGCYMDRYVESLFLARLLSSTVVYELFKPIGGERYTNRCRTELHVHLYDIDRVLA